MYGFHCYGVVLHLIMVMENGNFGHGKSWKSPGKPSSQWCKNPVAEDGMLQCLWFQLSDMKSIFRLFPEVLFMDATHNNLQHGSPQVL